MPGCDCCKIKTDFKLQDDASFFPWSVAFTIVDEGNGRGMIVTLSERLWLKCIPSKTW